MLIYMPLSTGYKRLDSQVEGLSFNVGYKEGSSEEGRGQKPGARSNWLVNFDVTSGRVEICFENHEGEFVRPGRLCLHNSHGVSATHDLHLSIRNAEGTGLLVSTFAAE
ncbi:hypothetical protein AMTR_s00131p00116580 [Amborella trichopoda]|uniref:Uncharacterized protein n=1 Tax=Amborella trichopoda TaxID=13333 RepID=W1NW23_AMBTC|nr:hypothetical protein AMTR_s00131p00116580 [Amborella trichopoda]